eukprot:CAMPEP_0182448698 /NCGR_PEP_ID=MMETSP1172-20130603/28895_1 /TAXON_ID=708627 /ORGANISM="Timspurckia oligopyrenoides, Strain CCMP3278" /LENGTH=324 /DNA_ID=CAMNT_0024645653 /DNA_START=52 /DNA_END=1026 /DNA_ORIENTATION=+
MAYVSANVVKNSHAVLSHTSACRSIPFGKKNNQLFSPQISNRCRSIHMMAETESLPKVDFLAASEYPSKFGTTLVIGGDRGLGLEMVKALTNNGCKVIAAIRKDKPSAELEAVNPHTVITGADFMSDNVDEIICNGLTEPVDTVMMVSGYFTTETLDEFNREEEVKMFKICAISPGQILTSMHKNKKFAPNAKIGFITSEGGSIGLRTEKEGGLNYGHHMSKASSNMLGKLLAYDLKPFGISMVMIHPGFLRTDMTADKYSHLWDELGAVTAATAVPYILQCVADLSLESTGRFVAAMGAHGLGLGIYAIEDPSKLVPGADLPW